MKRELICCPNCFSPLLCDLKTNIRFVKKELYIAEEGVEIDSEADDDDISTVPVMYSDEHCICCGYYGSISDSPDAIFYQYINLRCPECGELKEYAIYHDEKFKKYKLIRRDELREMQVNKYRKDRRRSVNHE